MTKRKSKTINKVRSVDIVNGLQSEHVGEAEVSQQERIKTGESSLLSGRRIAKKFVSGR